ncbi:camp-dependent protein kinase catalytic subunit [Podochytrium sp. JEL0797]|nr:camp-dependent protein kinase catalytic subunit [Podochytrium sp. JEL0797]
MFHHKQDSQTPASGGGVGLFSKMSMKKKSAEEGGNDSTAAKALSKSSSQMSMSRNGSNHQLPSIPGPDVSSNNLTAGSSARSKAKSVAVAMDEDGNIRKDSPAVERHESKKSVVGSIFNSLRRSKSIQKSSTSLAVDASIPLPNVGTSNAHLQAATKSMASGSSNTSLHSPVAPPVSEFSGRCSVSSRHQKSNSNLTEIPVPSIPAGLKKSVASLGGSSSQDASHFHAEPMPTSPKKSIFGQKFDFLNKPSAEAEAAGEPGALNKDKSTAKSMPKISLFGRKSMKAMRSASEQPPLGSTAKQVSQSGHHLDLAVGAHAHPSDGSMAGLGSGLTPDKRAAGLSAYEISSTQVQRTYTLDDFHIVRKVGKGGFATVFLVRMKASTGRYYALKAIKKADLIKLKQEKQVINEKAILTAIKLNFIVELYHSFQDTHHLYMIIEYIDGGDLFSYLRKVQKFGEEDGRFYTCEVLIALQYLHAHNVVYRDLKPENILLDTTGHVKLADFGFAKVITGTTNSFCGTPDYIAREIVRNRAYGKAVDWWSFGVLIFELVSGKTPFGDDSSEQIYENITEMKIKWHPMIKGTCKDIIKRLLEPDPSKRLGTLGDGDEIRAQPFYAKVNWQKVEERKTTPPFLPACDTPEAIEKRVKRGGGVDDFANMLKSAGAGKVTTDLFSDAFKGF